MSTAAARAPAARDADRSAALVGGNEPPAVGRDVVPGASCLDAGHGGNGGVDAHHGSTAPRAAIASPMPFKSQAQRRKFAELLVKGEISPETYEEWNRETGSKKLPERVTKKARRRTKKR